MEIAKEQIFSKLKMDPVSPDIGKRHFNKTVARKFGILPPQGCGVRLLAILQIQALFSLPSKSTFYTCSHMGTLDPWKPHADKQKTMNWGVCERTSVCWSSKCLESALHVDIRYEELSLIIVAYDQVKGVYSFRVLKPGCWPCYTSSKISDCHDTQLKNC